MFKDEIPSFKMVCEGYYENRTANSIILNTSEFEDAMEQIYQKICVDVSNKNLSDEQHDFFIECLSSFKSDIMIMLSNQNNYKDNGY